MTAGSLLACAGGRGGEGSAHDPPCRRLARRWAGAALPLSLLPATLVALGFFGLVWKPLTWVPWAVPVGLASGWWAPPF